MHFLKAVVLSGLRPFLPSKVIAQLEKPLAQHRYERIERPKRLQFFGRLLKPGELCFDVGAHVGELTGLFLELGANVVAVEPQPQCAATLKAEFGGKLTAVVEAALAAEEGEATLYIADETVASTLSGEFRSVMENSQVSDWFRGRKWEKEVKVQTTTLDKLIERYGMPAFCKIDVEGFEHQVVQGLSRPIERMSLEYTGEDLKPVLKAVERLESMASYRYNFSKLSEYEWQLDAWCQADQLREHLARISASVATGDVYAVRAERLGALGFTSVS